MDIPACNLVVRFDAVSTLSAVVQSRGRARCVSGLLYCCSMLLTIQPLHGIRRCCSRCLALAVCPIDAFSAWIGPFLQAGEVALRGGLRARERRAQEAERHGGAGALLPVSFAVAACFRWTACRMSCVLAASLLPAWLATDCSRRTFAAERLRRDPLCRCCLASLRRSGTWTVRWAACRAESCAW